MTAALALLCIGAFATVAIATSALTGALWAASGRWRARLSPRAESRLVLAAIVAPGFLGLAALSTALLPSLGWLPDHCMEHATHHPHLCVQHAAGLPSLPLLALAGLLAGRCIWAWAHAARAWLQMTRTAHALGAGARTRDGMCLLPAPAPEAFVMGLMAPRVYVTEGLLEMPGHVVEVVLAHERAHARHRDPLYAWLASLALACHVPGLAARLARTLRRTQEMAADAAAAAALGDAPRVAEVLVQMARVRQSYPASMLAFAGGSIEARVRRLLAANPHAERPTRAALGALALALLLAMLAAAGPVHHALETALGILS